MKDSTKAGWVFVACGVVILLIIGISGLKVPTEMVTFQGQLLIVLGAFIGILFLVGGVGIVIASRAAGSRI